MAIAGVRQEARWPGDRSATGRLRERGSDGQAANPRLASGSDLCVRLGRVNGLLRAVRLLGRASNRLRAVRVGWAERRLRVGLAEDHGENGARRDGRRRL